MGYKTLFEQIKTVCAWNSFTGTLRIDIEEDVDGFIRFSRYNSVDLFVV